MSTAKRIADYLEDVLDGLEEDDFEIFEDEKFDGRPFHAVATKTKGVGTGHQELVVVFAMFRRLTEAKLDEFLQDAYDYAKTTRRSSWPVGLNNMLWVYPVAVAEEMTDRAYDHLLSEKPRIYGFGYVAFPVVYAADLDEVRFFEGNSGALGGRTMNKVAKFVEDYLDLD